MRIHPCRHVAFMESWSFRIDDETPNFVSPRRHRWCIGCGSFETEGKWMKPQDAGLRYKAQTKGVSK